MSNIFNEYKFYMNENSSRGVTIIKVLCKKRIGVKYIDYDYSPTQ